jgi:hypothetical protein
VTERLIDATTGLTVVIAERDRWGAVNCSPTKCVGANRLRRLRGALDARVGADSARIQRQDGWHRYDLHPSTAAAVRAYDKSGQAIPAGFRFVLVPPRKPLGTRSGERPGSNRRSGKRQSVATRSPSTRSLFVEPPQ